MAAHTGTMRVKQEVGKAWLVVMAFAVAAVLVIGLIATRDGSSAPTKPANVQTQVQPQTQPQLSGGTTGGTSGVSTKPQGQPPHVFCPRCAL